MDLIKAWNSLIGDEQNVHATGNALHVLNHTNAQIHQKEAYHFGRKFTLAAGATVLFCGKTMAPRVHFHELASVVVGGGPIDIDFYHGSEVSTGTNENALGNVHNRDLDVSSTSQMLILSSPTIVTTGSLIVPGANPATPSIGGGSAGAQSSILGGFILASSADYVIGMHNNASLDTATIWINFGFSEPVHL